MGKDTKMTPAERLLALIRPEPAAAGGPETAHAQERTSRRGGLFARRRQVHIGVDIAPDQLVCVKVHGQDADFRVQQTALVPLPQDAHPGSDAFVLTLRRGLSELCEAGEKPQIWAAIQSARINVQYVTIPKVASRLVDNAVFWTAKKEMSFDEHAMVFDFERRGEVAEKGALRIGALAYTAEREKAWRIRDDFIRAGFPLSGLTMEPFTYQTLSRRGVGAGNTGTTANLHVGRNWSRLEISHDGDLMFVRSIKTSMSGMEQAVLEALEARVGGHSASVAAPESAVVPSAPGTPPPSGESVVDLDDLHLGDTGLVLELDTPKEAPKSASVEPATPTQAPTTVTLEDAKKLFRCLVFGCDDKEIEALGHDFDESAILAMLEPAASRLVRQVEMTLKHFRESLGFDTVSQLTVSGLLGASRVFLEYIGDQLGLSCVALDPLYACRFKGCVVPELSAPSVIYTQAVGLALADDAVTPNLLHTYKAKAEARSARVLEQVTLVGLAVVLLGLAFFSLDALWDRQNLAAEEQRLSRELASLGGKPDLSALTRKAAELKSRRDAARQFASRGQLLGLWGTVLSLAPEGVGVGTLTAEFGPPQVAAKSKPDRRRGQPSPAATSQLVITGMITGDARLFDSKLASYVVGLETCSLFDSAMVKQHGLEQLNQGASGLRFMIVLTVPEY